LFLLNLSETGPPNTKWKFLTVVGLKYIYSVGGLLESPPHIFDKKKELKNW